MPSVMELETLVTRLTGDATGLIRSLDQAERALTRTAAKAEAASNIVESAILSLGGVAQQTVNVMLAVGAGLGAISYGAIKTSAQMEVLESSFRNLIGSAEDANKVLADINTFALNSPFITPQLVEAAVELSAFGRATEEILPDLKMLGDISRGDSQKFNEMVMIYGKIIESGRLYQRDINQLARRGVPVYLELAKMLGLVADNAKKVPKEVVTNLRTMVQHGQIDSGMIENIFQKITSPGGQFHGQMEARMKTLSGMWSNVREQSFLAMREIGDALVEGLNLKPLVDKIQEVGKEFTTFMKNLTPEVKEAVRVVIFLTGAFVGLAAAIYLAGIVYNVMFGGVGIIIGIIVTLIATTAAWTLKIGGLEEAWLKVKRAANDLWDFLKPILPWIGLAILYLNPPLGLFIIGLTLAIKYWDEIKRAVEEFYVFARPTLTALWSLLKTIAFLVRDTLVEAWRYVEMGIGYAAAKVQEFWKSMGGGEIDWSKVKSGMQEFVIFMEFMFRRMDLAGLLAWETIKYGAVVMMDEILKSILIVPSTIVAAFVFMAVALNQLFFSALKAIAKGVGQAVEAIWESIKSGKAPDIAQELAKVFASGIKEAQDEIVTLAAKAKVAMGETTINTMKFGGFDIPIGFKSEGLGKLRQETYTGLKATMSEVQEQFQPFKEKKLLEFAQQDAADMADFLFRRIMTPMQFAFEHADEMGKKTGYAYGQAFAGEFKKVEATLFSSAEAISRIDEYKTLLRDPTMIERTRVTSNQIEIAPMPHEPQQKVIDVLERIDQHIIDQTNRRVNDAGRGVGGLIAANL
jgi:tape measure protein